MKYNTHNMPKQLVAGTIIDINTGLSFSGTFAPIMCISPFTKQRYSDGTIYRIVSNIAILRSYLGISLSRLLPLKRSRYSAQLSVTVSVKAVYAVSDIDKQSLSAA